MAQKTFKKFQTSPPNFENVARAALDEAKQIPKEKWWGDMLDILRRTPLTDDEVKEALTCIIGRLPSKNCVRCRKLKADGVEGSVRVWKGFGRMFVCSACQGILEEKGQLE